MQYTQIYSTCMEALADVVTSEQRETGEGDQRQGEGGREGGSIPPLR